MKVKVNWDTDNYPLEECNLKKIVDIPNDIEEVLGVKSENYFSHGLLPHLLKKLLL